MKKFPAIDIVILFIYNSNRIVRIQLKNERREKWQDLSEEFILTQKTFCKF